jgi:GTP1/Obg family GTP-binding protein
MSSKYFYSFCLLLLVASLAITVRAQSEPIEVETTPIETEAPVEETTAPTRPTFTEVREDRVIALQARTQARITNLAANISNRLEAYISRLQNITDRFSSRMDKLESTGVDVTIARASLARAQGALDAAKTDMTDIDASVAEVTGSNNPLQAWREVQGRFISARDSIRVAFNELRTVMIDLRGALATPPPVAEIEEVVN